MERFLKWALIVLGIACLLVYGYLLWGDQIDLAARVATSPSRPTQQAVDLWEGYEEARATARVEAQDALMVSASTQWQATDERTLLDGSDDWTFVFYSAANRNVLDVTVDKDAVHVVNQTRVWKTPRILDEGAWKEGPRDALQVFLAHQGSEFLAQHPGALVDLHLNANNEGVPTWSITALDPEKGEVITLIINAETMQVLSRSS